MPHLLCLDLCACSARRDVASGASDDEADDLLQLLDEAVGRAAGRVLSKGKCASTRMEMHLTCLGFTRLGAALTVCTQMDI